MYFKFKNSLGGYSYWLFENWNNEESNQNLGVLKGWDGLKDLGNEIDPAISVTSKIPKRFFPLIQDLIISEEIYIYTPGDGYSKQGVSIWEKITSNNNKLSQNLFNENEKVKLKFDRHYRYNPSVLW